MDLGLALLRARSGPALRVWLATLVLPALVLLACCLAKPWLALLLFWWLKPLLDRPLLHLLAMATFGPAPSLGRTLRALPDSCRRGVAATLLWRRLSPARALLLPVWQLEQPRPGAFGARRRVLLQRGRAQAWLLSLVCLGFTGTLFLGALSATAYLTPGEGPGIAMGLDRLGLDPAWTDRLEAAVALLAMAAVEPFFVAAGYGLYLNRRVHLEGWDLELAFRQLGRRIRQAAHRGAAPLLALLLVLAGAGMRGAEVSSPAKEALARVLREPEFGSTRQVWRLRPRHPEPERPAPQFRPPSAWLVRLLDLLALVLKFLLPTGLIALIGYALWSRRGSLWPRTGGDREAGPAVAGDQAARPERLPRDVAKAAAGLWDRGEPRAALALLYRGALARLLQDAPAGAALTEAECLALGTRRLAEPAAAYLARLVRTWQAAAYAGRLPAAQDRDLCAAWARYFPAQGPGAP
jgi:hypothetical protein